MLASLWQGSNLTYKITKEEPETTPQPPNFVEINEVLEMKLTRDNDIFLVK